MVSRRAFLRTSLAAGTLGTLGAFGGAALAFMWPNLGEGFGAVIDVGDALEIADQVESERAPMEYPQGRLYVAPWDPDVAGAQDAYGEDHPVLDDGRGLMALYQQCPHLGCRVPWCLTSQWFECPCHGSKYNRWGEWTDGPAPRGLDRFPAEIDDEGRLLVNTGVLITGPSRTGRVLAQQPEGPHCIDL